MATQAQIEKALQDFVQQGTGLDDAHVIWSDGKPRPSAPYVALSWQESNDDLMIGEVSAKAGVTPGTIVHAQITVGQHTVQLQCFGPAPTGDSTARQLLRRLVKRSQLPSMLDILNAADIGYSGFDAVQNTPQFNGRVAFEPRAVTNFQIFLTEVETEVGNRIERVGITNLDGVKQNVPKGT